MESVMSRQRSLLNGCVLKGDPSLADLLSGKKR